MNTLLYKKISACLKKIILCASKFLHVNYKIATCALLLNCNRYTYIIIKKDVLLKLPSLNCRTFYGVGEILPNTLFFVKCCAVNFYRKKKYMRLIFIVIKLKLYQGADSFFCIDVTCDWYTY